MTDLSANHHSLRTVAPNPELAPSCDTAATIHDLIATFTSHHPHRAAVIDGETVVDYVRLTARADAIAATLLARGVTPGSLVGVCLPRTWELIATLIGVQRAGCAYVPLDPAYPAARVRFMLEHSRAAAVILDDDDAAALCDGAAELVWLRHVDAAEPRHAPVQPKADDLAYVIYTSGSTGQPKGVAVGHDNLLAMSRAMGELLSQAELEGVFAGASVCFDTSVMETLGALSLGGTVILGDNALALPTLPMVDKVRTCVMVPSAMQALLAGQPLPASIRCVVFGGEALKLSLVRQIQALPSAPRVINAYGPTEDTVFSTICELRPGAERVTIGRSVAGGRAYILDETLQPLAPGVPGELLLAGEKLARGYLHEPALTEARFVTVSASAAVPESRLYRTGDLAQWCDNGEIEFLGRVDQQVKVRGYRIELGEIESVLEAMDGVDAAAAAAHDGPTGAKVLVIYVVSRDPAVTETSVKSFLAQRLPEYMVPQWVMALDALPLLPSDKLDRARLPDLAAVRDAVLSQSDAAPGPSCAAPASLPQQHAALVAIIQREAAALLHVSDPEQLAAHDAFDRFGLDSLTKPELSRRLSKALGRDLPVQALFHHATPSALADALLSEAVNQTPTPAAKPAAANVDSLGLFQAHIQSSHPTFQAAKANAWSATDKGKLVQEVMRLVNDDRRNPYSKVIRTGSASRGLVGDAYTDEEQEAVIWTTNLYLGLNRDPAVIAAARDAVENFGTGMGTSAAASGMTDLHLAFEDEFAALTGKAAACLFPTGYTANVGVIAGLLGPGDVVVLDQLCHASIVDGARLCGATIRTFQHNNADDLAAVLASETSPYRTVLVAIEGVYSMGEGAAPVAELVRTAKEYGALVLVDEAHSFGFYGPRGAGICAATGVTDEVDFIMTTLSKALGSLGGVIAARREYVDLLKSSARAYIFQASVSPADMAAALTALRRLSSDEGLRTRLWDTTRYMRERFTAAGYDLGTGDGPIVTPHFADKDKLYALVQGMFQRGVQVSAVTYPIVEPGRGRLRLICSASHTRADVDKTLAALIDAEREIDAGQAAAAPQHTLPSRDDLETWGACLAAFLCEAMAAEQQPLPDLAVTVHLGETQEALTLQIQNQNVSFGDSYNKVLPHCGLRLSGATVLSALNQSDVQALLRCIAAGTCVLQGQVEPFIWLIGRLVDWRASAGSEVFSRV